MEIKKTLQGVQGGFEHGNIANVTEYENTALMEHDVPRISELINTQLIDPVIDFVIASDDVISEAATTALNKANSVQTLADNADRLAGQANSKATDALRKADDAAAEAARAHTRIDGINVAPPNLDLQTWQWMPREYDSVSINTSGVSLANPAIKPTITWMPCRHNTETNSYILEGRFRAFVKIDLIQWAGAGVDITEEKAYKMWNGWITLDGLSSDVMKPIASNVNVSAMGDENSSNYTKEWVRYAGINMHRSSSVFFHMTVVANSERLDPFTNPVYATIEMTFLRDSGGNFGYGEMYPPLTPSA